MDAFEKAIRDALAKGDAEDRAFREKVYRSAFAALERAAEKNPELAPETIERRTEALKRKVSEIESEFIPAVASPAVEPRRDDAVASGRIEPEFPTDDFAPAGTSRQTGPGDAPSVSLDDAPRRQGGARSGSDFDVEADPRPERAGPRRRIFSVLLIAATLVSAIGIGAWWLYQSDLLTGPDPEDLEVPNPPLVLEDEEFDPGPDQDGQSPLIPGTEDNRDWVAVFSPDDPTRVTAPAGASAQLLEGDDAVFLRIQSESAAAAVTFEVGQGILEQLAGRTAIFSILLRAQEEQETEISVDCDFAALGDCGRKRFVAEPTQGEFLFEVEFPDASPGGAGTIAITPDISGEGKAVDIFEIRVAGSR